MKTEGNVVAFKIIQGEIDHALGAMITEHTGEIANTHAGLITVAMAAVTVVSMSSGKPVTEVLMDMIEMSPGTTIKDISKLPTKEAPEWSEYSQS